MFQKKRNTFHGGVHPYEGKELSKDKPIVKAQPGNLLYYAVSQHIGAPAVPIVQKGDHVKAGQKIAEAGGFVSAPVYASVSGTVKGIEKKVSAAGSPVDCIVVENDGLYEKETFEECPHWEKLDADTIRKKIKEAGIVGMGGAGFPTHVKVSPKDPSAIDHILVNGIRKIGRVRTISDKRLPQNDRGAGKGDRRLKNHAAYVPESKGNHLH